MVAAVSLASGLEVAFDWAIDDGAWPGPLASTRTAVMGQAWLGPLGLLARLELELGLGGQHATPVERASALARALARTDGFWSRSLEVDRLATAERILLDRDMLALWGWRGEPVSERLDSLWLVSVAFPGVPDRLRSVIERLACHRVDIAAMRLFEPTAALPPLWHQLVQVLQAAGTRIDELPIPVAASSGDLGSARSGAFMPVGDGSLQLVRPHGVLAAADEAAAALAACRYHDELVVIGADAVLDAALARHGMPRTGAAVARPGSAALVRLCVETVFHPMDAAHVHALLCTEPSPIPRRVAWRLATSIRRFPGRRTPLWRDALASGLDAVEPGRRDAVAALVSMLLDPIADHAAEVPVVRIVERISTLAEWARGRVATDTRLSEVIAMSDRLVGLLQRLGRDRFGLAELRRCCDAIEVSDVRGVSAELGPAALSGPGALLGPVRRVMWWNFTREAAPRAPRVRLSRAERDALAAAGVAVPDAGDVMAHEARRWRRPLELATEALVLVCPRTDDVGEPAQPHPLWDELIAGMPEASRAAVLVASQVSFAEASGPVVARREPVALRSTPAASGQAKVARSTGLREVESVSSIEMVLGCPLAYALRYLGGLRPGLASAAAVPGPLLGGQVAHHVLAAVFADGALDPEVAATRATAFVDDMLPHLAETLMLSHHQAERAAVRRAIVQSARVVAVCVARTGASIRGVEVPLAGTVGGVKVEGRADLVLSDPDHVIDFKWGTTTPRERLRAGAAVQLAIYSELACSGATRPGVAYLSLRTQRVFAARATQLPGALTPTEHSVDDMLAGLLAALGRREVELRAGQFAAPGAVDVGPRSQLSEGILELAPSCEYCAFDGLCGRRGCP